MDFAIRHLHFTPVTPFTLFRSNAIEIPTRGSALASDRHFMRVLRWLAAGTRGRPQGIAKPLASVCIPTFNQASFLGEAIASAVAQEYPAVEIIVSDNHSTDETGRVLQRYANTRGLKVVRPSSHVSMFKNFQFCADQCSGEYAVFLSSDDYLRPAFLERLVGVVRTRPKVAYAYSACTLIDATGKTVGTTRHPFGSFARRGATHLRHLVRGSRGVLSGTVIRMESFRRIGGFDPSLQIVGDWQLFLRLACVGDVEYRDEELACYRTWSTPAREQRLLRHLEEIGDLYQREITALVNERRVSGRLVEGARRRRATEAISALGGLETVLKREEWLRAVSRITPEGTVDGVLAAARGAGRRRWLYSIRKVVRSLLLGPSRGGA